MNERSIQKLRIKFIVSATFAYMTAMLLMGAIIYGTNLIVTNMQIGSILDYIVSNEGELPSPSPSPTPATRGEEEHAHKEARPTAKAQTREAIAATSSPAREEEDEETPADELISHTLSLDDIFSTNREFYDTQEFLYSTRYFAVIFDSAEEVESVRLNHISSVDEESAIALCRTVLKRRLRFGHQGAFSFKKASLNGNRTIVVFLDSRNQVATNIRLLYTSLMVLGFGLIIVLFLVRLLSYRSIQPEIENARRQEQFITNASHELKTPLAVIRANTEVEQMLHGEDEWNKSTLDQIDRMTSLIQNLVLISRARERQDKTHAIQIDASKAVRETAETFQPVASQEGKTLKLEIPEGISLLGEDGDLRQLTSLLVDNAIKYCDESGTITVTLGAKSRGALRLIVSNNYAAGAKVNYDRFFDRFYREDESHNIGKGGFGIGLSIAESLVQKYQGQIKATWKDGIISFTCLLKG